MKRALPHTVKNKQKGDNIRIWVPGCATGEETYSIAMLLYEQLGREVNHYNIQIFGTDLDQDAIMQARRGIYPMATVVDVDKKLLDKFFTHADNTVQVIKSIREMIVFAKQDLTQDPPFSHLDLVSCRNLLIYFNSSLQKKIVPMFHYILNPDGLLFLGKSESIGQFADLFVPMVKKWKIFQRRGTLRSPAIDFGLGKHLRYAGKGDAAIVPKPREVPIKQVFAESVINAMGNCAVMIDERQEIVFVQGEVAPYLTLAQGEIGLSILNMARPEIRLDLRAIVHKATRENRFVRSNKINFKYNDRNRQIILHAGPAAGPTESVNLTLVMFEEVTPVAETEQDFSDEKPGGDPRMMELEQELAATREHLQTTVEELETTNEELQSLNEELQSSNEELETSNEELQSTNEELTTVNEELQVKSGELAEANTDLENILNRSGIAMIIVNNQLKVTRFTPTVRQFFQLTASDWGHVITTIPSTVDIPDLRRTLLTVVESGEPTEHEFNMKSGRYFLLDIKGIIQEVNLTGAEMIGRQRAHISGKPLFVYIKADYRKVLFNHLRKIWEGHSDSVEVVFLKTNQDVLPVELFSVPVADEQERIIQCRIAATDISKRWEAEEALRESQRKLDSIVKTIPDIVYRLDPGGIINFISEGIRRYGYRPGELLGKSIMRLVHPQDHPIARHRINERRTGSRSAHGMEIRLLSKNGQHPAAPQSAREDRYFLVNAEGLYSDSGDAPGQFIGTQGIAHDITGRKQSEIERMRLEAELQKARKIEIIEQCVKRGSELTQQLLGFAKGGKFNVKTIHLNQIVADTARLFGRTRKAIQINQRLDPNLQPVDADPGQLEQVLLNLLINADQAMPEGGRIDLGTENIEFENNELSRLGLQPDKYIGIFVEDTGIGMDQETQNRIFEPFFTTKAMGRGTGLGLASAYGIIKNHGGMIDVASIPGQGSRFAIYLPASSGKVVEQNELTPGIAKGTGTILLVDDENIIINVGSKMLGHLGYRVVTAKSGKQAIAIYQDTHNRIDLVILDMVMPEMNGYETYGKLKRINPRIKVLLSSGYTKNGQASEIVTRDRQDFIQKPFDLAKLSQKVSTILAN